MLRPPATLPTGFCPIAVQKISEGARKAQKENSIKIIGEKIILYFAKNLSSFDLSWGTI